MTASDRMEDHRAGRKADRFPPLADPIDPTGRRLPASGLPIRCAVTFIIGAAIGFAFGFLGVW